MQRKNSDVEEEGEVSVASDNGQDIVIRQNSSHSLQFGSSPPLKNFKEEFGRSFDEISLDDSQKRVELRYSEVEIPQAISARASAPPVMESAEITVDEIGGFVNVYTEENSKRRMTEVKNDGVSGER